MDLTNFEQFKESENYIVYLQKDRANKKQFEMIVSYKKYPGRAMRCLMTDTLFKLFFEPTEFAKVYMKSQEKQK
jgi:hypothetical protein